MRARPSGTTTRERCLAGGPRSEPDHGTAHRGREWSAQVVDCTLRLV